MSPVDLLARPCWVFDMDGTLTVPQHDFAAFKRQHGLPEDRDVLGAIAELPSSRAAEIRAAVDAWELELAAAARAEDDALALLDELGRRGARFGVLTRNTKEGAALTLRAAGLDRFFPDDTFVLGRDCAAHKPSPDGIARLLGQWGADPAQAVMVGDWVYDVQAGRNAGTATVLVERHGPCPEDWRPWADVCVPRLTDLLP